jgi:mannose-6-phosphate isomerase-like protein (cupin superfamily)
LIKHIIQSESDKLVLSELSSKKIIQNEQPDNYEGIIVPKPWGMEFSFFKNDFIDAWFLSIEKNHSTSMHCHPNKRTILIILSGIALGKTLHGSSIIKAGEVVVYEAGVFHSTKAITKIEMAEIESPPIKTDLIRYNDNYNRVKMGYEDKKTMIRSSSYFYLTEENCLFSQEDYVISKSDRIKSGSLNVIGECDCYKSNSLILETKNIKLDNSHVINFTFPSKEKLYEYRKHI